MYELSIRIAHCVVAWHKHVSKNNETLKLFQVQNYITNISMNFADGDTSLKITIIK